jgi:hypothetical protein
VPAVHVELSWLVAMPYTGITTMTGQNKPINAAGDIDRVRPGRIDVEPEGSVRFAHAVEFSKTAAPR